MVFRKIKNGFYITIRVKRIDEVIFSCCNSIKNKKSQHIAGILMFIMLKTYSLLSTLAHVSRKPTVLLNTSFSAVESLSTAK